MLCDSSATMGHDVRVINALRVKNATPIVVRVASHFTLSRVRSVGVELSMVRARHRFR